MKNLNRILVLVSLVIVNMLLWGCVINNDQNTISGDRVFSTDNRHLADFSEIQVKGDFDVELIPSEECMVVIDADANLQSYIYSEVEGGKLVISQPENIKLKSLRSINVKVLYIHLKGIELIGNATIGSSDQVKFDSLYLSFIGAAKAEFDLRGNYLSGVFPGAVGIELKGNVNEVRFDFPGAVKLDASEMEVSKFSISMEGAGKADLFVKNELNVAIAGAGYVNYKGNPAKVTSSIGGIGSVNNLED